MGYMGDTEGLSKEGFMQVVPSQTSSLGVSLWEECKLMPLELGPAEVSPQVQ